MARRTATRVTIGLAVLALGACETILPSTGGMVGAPHANFAMGSTLNSSLKPADRLSLADAFVGAMETADERATANWSTDRAEGAVEARSAHLRNLLSDPNARVPAPAGLDVSKTLETELGEYVTRDDVVARLAPSGDAPQSGWLPAGTSVTALGQSSDWVLVAHNGRAVGYIPSDKTGPAPGRDLVLAGGPKRKPEMCRAFTQRVTVKGRTDVWVGAACARNGDWYLEDLPAGI